MSDMADYYIEKFLDDGPYSSRDTRLYDNVNRAKKALDAGVWYQNDGKPVFITSMDEAHIKNCIAMIKRKRLIHLECYIPAFELVLAERREGDNGNS